MKGKRHARQTLNFLVPDINGRHVCVFGCFTMQSVLWRNALQCPYNWGVGSVFYPMKIHISVISGNPWNPGNPGNLEN